MLTACGGGNWQCMDSQCASGKKYQTCSECSDPSFCRYELRVGQGVVYQCTTAHNEPSCASLGIISVCQ